MKLPLMSSQELCRFLQKEGFVLVRQKGSHRFYRHSDGRTTVVPMHSNKDIKRSLLLGILHEIRTTREEFMEKMEYV